MRIYAQRLNSITKWVVSFLFIGTFLIYLGYLSRDLWIPPVQDQPPPSKSSVNENIELSQRMVPSYVQSGIVKIGNPNDFSTYHLTEYRFGRRLSGERSLQSETGESYGMFTLKNSKLQKIDSISQLQNGDFVYVTFYKTLAWSDSGRRGETLLGIIESLEKKNGVVMFRFAADPSGRTFELPRNTEILTEDHEGLFDFGDDLFDSLRKGSTLRILVDDKGLIRRATVIGPKVSVDSGRVERVSIGDSETEISLANSPYHFFIDEKTKIVKRGEPDNPKVIADLKKGMDVHLVYYNNLNQYTVLSLDFQEP